MRTHQMRSLLDSIDRHFEAFEFGVVNESNIKSLMTLLIIEDFAREFDTECEKKELKPILECLLNNCYVTDYNFFAKETDSPDNYYILEEVLLYIKNEYFSKLTIMQNGVEKGSYIPAENKDVTIVLDSSEYKAGTNITIAQDGTISAVDTKYTAGANVNISSSNVISATDTTYQSKQPVNGGTDVSLVTTGEKYIWNNKSNFSGNYNDLTNKPTIPAAQVNSDWNAISGVEKILNKPDLSIYAQSSSLANVATSGNYNDLTNKPSIPNVNDATLTIKQGGTTKGTFTANAGTDVTINLDAGSSSQVQSDWNQSDNTQVDYIKNKPTIPSISGLESASNKVTAFQSTPDDTHYPSEKLVKDSLDTKQGTIDSSHKLSADLVQDGTTNKVVTSTEKSTWSGKQDALVSGTNIKTINNESLLGSGNISVGGGTATDVQVNGTSITSNNVANIVTEGTYNASTNKIATMSDLPSVSVTDVTVGGTSVVSSGTAVIPAIPDISNLIAKSSTAGLVKNDGTIDTNTYLTQHQDISWKADKVSGATNGDLAGLDADGNLTDSGLTATSVSGAVADAHTHSNKAMLDLVPSSLGTAGQALCTNTNADGTEWKTIGGGGGSVNWSQIGSYTPAFGNLEDAAQNTLIPLSLKPIVTENSQTPILALNDGYLYVCGDVTSLDFTLNPPQSNDYVAEYHLFFTSGAIPTTINWAGGLRFTDGNTPTIESGKTYEINIINNCVLIQSYV